MPPRLPRRGKRYRKMAKAISNAKRARYRIGRSIPLRVGAPYAIVRKLRYFDQKSISPGTAGSPGVTIFTANNVHDPDHTGVGHQPRYFDEYMGLYNRFLVLGAKIQVQAVNLDTNPNTVGISILEASTPKLDITDYSEVANSARRTLDVAGSGQAIKYLTAKWSGKKWFHKPNLTTEYDLTGSSSAGPSTNSRVYFHVWTTSPTASDTGTVRVLVTIDYIVMFREPVQPAQS